MRYSPEQEQQLRDKYPTMKASELAAEFGVSKYAMEKKLSNMGLKKKTPQAKPHINTVDGRQYWRIAVGKKRLYVHRMNYEAKHGPVPDGHILECVDGDTLNAAAENWRPISKTQRMIDNQNPEGTSQGLKKLWAKVKLREQYGRPVHFCKFRSRMKTTVTRVTNHQAAKGVSITNI